MKRALFVVIGGSVLLAACGQASENSGNQSAAQPPQPKKRPAYCFFKPEETKGWSAKRAKDGNITVKGRGHVKDSRYKAVLGPATVSGTTAQIAPTITTNTGYEAPGDWWDVTATIPNSSAVTAVSVTCGDKELAQLKVAAKS